MLGKDGNEIFFFRLGLNRGQFDNAKSECGEDKSFDLLNYKCLSKWKETKGNKATVEELKKALKSIERQDIIEEIEKLERTNSVSDEGSEKMVAQAKEEVWTCSDMAHTYRCYTQIIVLVALACTAHVHHVPPYTDAGNFDVMCWTFWIVFHCFSLLVLFCYCCCFFLCLSFLFQIWYTTLFISM